MTLYIWKSEYLANYGKGKIIVFASSLEEARQLATIQFYLHDKENYDFGYDDAEGVQRRYELFEDDISKTPVITEHPVVFATGSH